MRRGSSPAGLRAYGPRRTRRQSHRRHWQQYEQYSTSSSISVLTVPLSKTRSIGLVLFIGLCVYVVYQMISVESDWFPVSAGGVVGFGRRCPSSEFVTMLSRHSTPDKFIVLALVDAAFADMAINLYESSLRPNGIENFLFVGAGRRACEILDNASLPCHHYTEDRDTDVASIYQSPGFIRKMNIRTEMILDALSVGFTVLHTDLDVVFIRNPIADLKVVLLTADLATMLDSVAHNAGFVVVRPTRYSRGVYERVKRITGFSRKTDDQTALNSAIRSMNSSYKKHGFNAVMLDRNKYLCGLDYFEKGNRVFPAKENCSVCVVVHNNWIVSREAKIYRFKEHFMWMYDKDFYYSNTSQSYLMYGNPTIQRSLASNDTEELAALKAALALGQILGRIVILPRFHCSKASLSGDNSDKRSSRRRGLPAAVMPSPPLTSHECPLNALLNITAFDVQFQDMYRESSFLRHPLVPAAVRNNVSEPYDLYSWQNTSDSKDGLPIDDVRVSADDVMMQFGAMQHHVLMFNTLYRVTPQFASVDEQRTFDDKVRKAFRRGTYRQL